MPFDTSAKQRVAGFGVSRRSLLGGMAGIGLSASLPGFVRRANAQSETPKRGGIMRETLSGDPPNFDIISNTSSQVLVIVAACYNSLIRFDPMDPTSIIGDLAESWDMSSDGLSHTFKLRPGVHFSDGSPLTSADVKATFDLIRNPPADLASPRKKLLATVENIEAPDDLTVVIHLSTLNPVLLATLASPWFVVAPKHVLEMNGGTRDVVIGSGPFQLANYSRGVKLELRRNPQYHDPERPYLDGIDFFIVPDVGTAFSYMRTGQLDNMGITGRETIEAAMSMSDKMTVQSANSYTADPYSVNTRREVFKDVRVRQALNMSIDRKLGIDIIADGYGAIGGLLPEKPWGMTAAELTELRLPGYWPDLEESRAEARRLLAEAGYPDGFETSILTRRGISTHDQRGIFLQDQFAKIGVRATLDPLETASYFEKLQAFNFDIATVNGSVPVNDPNFYLGDYHSCGGGQNYSDLCLPELDSMQAAQASETDPAKRAELARAFEIAALEQSSTCNLYFKQKYQVTSNRVQNFLLHPEPDNNLRRDVVWLRS